MDWIPASRTDVLVALERIPAGSFLLTSSHTDQRGGVPVKWVQQCSQVPPMVMVAVEKGHSLSPVIRDSRSFAVCQLDPNDRGTLRTFDQQQPGIDPFVGMLSTNTPSGAPVPARALAFIDCELARHVDIDGDHEIYVGVVHHAEALREGASGSRCLCGESALSQSGKRPTGSSTGSGNGTNHALNHGGNNGTAKSVGGVSPAPSMRAAANGHSRNGDARVATLGGRRSPTTGRSTATREAAAKIDRARKRR
jgi:flavin reductase (DIM6/NTAB) family NADH-FMN oxidoreductase RutF